MADEGLQRHYEQKYAHEVHGSEKTVGLNRRPSNRYEAAVATMHRTFRGGDILEVGGGDGIVARSLLKTGLAFDRYTLTDLSEARSTGAARSLADPRFDAFSLDVEKSTDVLDGRRYDAILMIALIEHLIDPIRAMTRIRSLLKPNGFVYIDTPNIAKYTRRIKLLAGYFPSTASTDEGLRTYGGQSVDLYDEGHLHYWTFRSMRGMLTHYCGFSDVEPAAYGHPLSGIWPQMFSDLAIVAR